MTVSFSPMQSLDEVDGYICSITDIEHFLLNKRTYTIVSKIYYDDLTEFESPLNCTIYIYIYILVSNLFIIGYQPHNELVHLPYITVVTNTRAD